MKKIISKFVREQKKYTFSEIKSIFEQNEENTIKILKILKEYGIVNSVNIETDKNDISDLGDEDIVVSPVEANNFSCYYVFKFVGLVNVYGIVLKCYPKYINKIEPTDELKKVLRVIEKYNSNNQIIKMYNQTDDSSSFNLLAVILYLLHDYYEHGIYTNEQEVVEINGNNEILWEKTINDSFAIIENNRPYYSELYSRKTEIDDKDYIKRLHEFILTQCSSQLESAGLFEFFNDLSPVYLSEECIEEFGDTNYILYRLENELNTQFITHKQIILKVIIAYIKENRLLSDINCISLFGTKNFNLIWEDVCKKIFNDMLHVKICNLPVKLHSDYTQDLGRLELIDIIEKPLWKGNNWDKGILADKTLIPDLITIKKDVFYIFDAKYYYMILEPTILRGQPGIESITKQYLYQLAYSEFIRKNNFSAVKNCFLLPTEENDVINYGNVSLGILDRVNLEKIAVRLLPAENVYDAYISNKLFEIEKIDI
ncbi:MAG: LlaJI family restriction endonuclease [Anaeroplasma sp.]|nr:LlaJI family restriction endonuclease [Anaeroplasma sp.]